MSYHRPFTDAQGVKRCWVCRDWYDAATSWPCSNTASVGSATLARPYRSSSDGERAEYVLRAVNSFHAENTITVVNAWLALSRLLMDNQEETIRILRRDTKIRNDVRVLGLLSIPPRFEVIDACIEPVVRAAEEYGSRLIDKRLLKELVNGVFAAEVIIVRGEERDWKAIGSFIEEVKS